MKSKIAIAGTGNGATRNDLPFLSREDDVELVGWNRTPGKAIEAALKQSIQDQRPVIPDTAFPL
jgi:predicted dehydrogenase